MTCGEEELVLNATARVATEAYLLITHSLSPNCSRPTELPLLRYNLLYMAKTLVSLFGLVLNLLSASIFIRKGRQSAFLILLLHLSIVEIFFNLGGIVFEVTFFTVIIMGTRITSLQFAETIGYVVLYFGWFVYKTALLARNWTIVYIAWRRYQGTRDPFKTIKRVVPNYASRSKPSTRPLFALIFFCALFTVPRVLEISYEICLESGQILPRETNLMQTLYGPIYHTFFFIWTSPLPIACVVYCSLAMLKSLRQQNEGFAAQFSLASTSAKRRNASTITVFILCIVFFVCELPMFVAGILSRTCSSEGDISEAFGGIANVLTNLDSVINFLVYYYALASFRGVLCSRPPRRRTAMPRNRVCGPV